METAVLLWQKNSNVDAVQLGRHSEIKFGSNKAMDYFKNSAVDRNMIECTGA
jgi:hypothetical protein